MNEEIKVSICCATYNHEKYIKKALDGFLMQKTNFKFEVIVHDDASTDNTANIIREYEKKYPEIIKPIYQTENQYQKGNSGSVASYRKSKGKYIAICEGDDYWIDENKLQKQVDYLEANPNCTICFHDAWILNDITNKKRKFIPYNYRSKIHLKSDKTYNAGEIMELGFIPVASIMFRNIIDIEEIARMYKNAIAGDVVIKIVSTSKGYAYQMDDIMCVYRTGNPNSAMGQWRTENVDAQKNVKRKDKFIRMYESLDEYTNYKYTKHFETAKTIKRIEQQMAMGRLDVIKEKYKVEYKKLYSIKERTKFFIKCKFPKLYNNIKGRVKRNG